MAPVVLLQDITKSFFTIEVLHRVRLEIECGEIHALLGENGAGKSTLIKILSGIYPPSSGKILKNGKDLSLSSVKDAQHHGINTIFQELSLIPNMNAWQNIFLGREKTSKFQLDKPYMRRKAKAILLSLGVDIDIHLPVSGLSIANQQFVEIAKALLEDSDVLILDEPTSTLTPKEVQHLFQVMRILQKRGVAMVFISHHLEELFEICQRVTILRDGAYIGVYNLSKMNKKNLISLMIGRENITSYPAKRKFPPNASPYFEVGKEPNRNNAFTIRKGEILGFFGLIGSGRTEFMLRIMGIQDKYKGILRLNNKTIKIRSPREGLSNKIGLLPEDRKESGLMLSTSILYNTIINNMTKFLFNKNRYRKISLKSSELLYVKCRDIDQEVKYLSGGNQQKVVISRWLCTDCELLIFDEPTRGIDIGAKQEIYQLMDRFVREGKAIIMISSEMNEIMGMSDRIMVMKKDEIAATLDSQASPDEILASAI